MKIFGKYYWSSHGLLRDVPTFYVNTDYNSLNLQEYSIPDVRSIRLKYENHLHYDTKK